MAHKALIVVDTQVDFCPGGSLATANGDIVAKRIQEYILKNGWTYRLVLATRDWHPNIADFDHFSKQPDYHNTWPPHCVAGTPGADFNKALMPIHFDRIFFKGQKSAAYSGFEGIGSTNPDSTTAPDLNTYLKRYSVTEVDICGIATDFCVRATATSAIDLGYRTTVISDLCSPVSTDGETQAIHGMVDLGIDVITLEAV